MQEEKQGEEDSEVTLIDRFTPYLVVRASGKVRSFDFGEDTKPGIHVSELFLVSHADLTGFSSLWH